MARDVFWQSFWRRRLFFSSRWSPRPLPKSSKSGLRKPTLSGSLFCHKEPFLCFAPPGFANEFKNAKFIHIFRDGRDNADSMVRTYSDAFSDVVLRDRFLIENKSSEVGLHRDVRGYCVPWWVKPDGEEAFLEASQFGRYLYMWREMTLRAQALRELGPSRYLEIRYEDFVERPSEIVAKVSAFLGRDSMKSKTARTAFKRSVGISARRQDAEKLNEARQIAGDLLLSLGYQTADSMTGNECIEEKMGIACPTALG